MQVFRPRLFATAVFACCAIFPVCAQNDSRKIAAAVLHQPSAMPDRIILTWASDPATSAAVTWRTDTSVSKALAQIALATDGPSFLKAARSVDARMEVLKTNLGTAHYHSVRFEQLQPDTQYVYRVGDGENWSDWNQFKTAAAGPAPLEFIYVGDAQNDIYSMWSRVIRSSFSDAPKSRFILHAGDLINNNDRDEQWGEWHQGAGWINRSVFSIPTPGNHEYKKQPDGRIALTVNWRPQFTLPENGIPSLPETNYYLDIQDVRIVSLNSNVQQTEQAAWLERLLANNPNRWTILTFHHPILSTAKGRDNPQLRALWQPIIDKSKVDLVLTGHDHTYGRSNLQTGLSTMKAGTVYVVSVSGPKMYQLEKSAWMERSAEDTQLYQIIRINGDKLAYEARTARGTLYDAFELQKRSGKPNRLTNRVPNTPENRRSISAPSQ